MGNFSVLPNAAEKSLKKKINTLAIMVMKTYVQLCSLKLTPKVKTPLNKSILSRNKGNDSNWNI